jgi:hypothetical protein
VHVVESGTTVFRLPVSRGTLPALAILPCAPEIERASEEADRRQRMVAPCIGSGRDKTVKPPSGQ